MMEKLVFVLSKNAYRANSKSPPAILKRRRAFEEKAAGF
jgi:hypothetical protein